MSEPDESPERPSLVQSLLYSIDSLCADDRGWLEACRAVCEARLPREPLDIYKMVPEAVWRFVPWGHRLVVLRTPMVDRIGHVIVPDQAKKENSVGWVLTVGRELATPDGKLPDVLPFPDYPLPDGIRKHYGLAAHCLLLVGQPVLFGQWTGKALRLSAYDDTLRQLDGASPLMLMNVGDIWGPYLDMKSSEWASEQPAESRLIQ